jgi:predicted nucleic acid-binding protein
LRELAFDALIALSVRDIGAILITCDRKDFEEIRKHKQFKVVYW